MSKIKIMLIIVVVLIAIFLTVSFIAKYVFNQKVESSPKKCVI
jgi:regulatory protein YycI of two-component signal transduction system YycFG